MDYFYDDGRLNSIYNFVVLPYIFCPMRIELK